MSHRGDCPEPDRSSFRCAECGRFARICSSRDGCPEPGETGHLLVCERCMNIGDVYHRRTKEEASP